jgi:phage pi2 protein 07
MEKIEVAPVSQYASWATPESSNMLTTELPTQVLVEESPFVELPTDEINVVKAEEVQKELVQQSISTLKELTNNPEVQKALESEGLTVDYAAINQTWNDGTGFANAAPLLKALAEKAEATVTEPETEEVVARACTDCVEDADNDVDTDTMLIIHDLSERLTALEERIALFNTKSSHKI